MKRTKLNRFHHASQLQQQGKDTRENASMLFHGFLTAAQLCDVSQVMLM